MVAWFPVEPGDILGHAKLKVTYTLVTPIYSIRQQHDVDLSHFRPRDPWSRQGLEL